MAVFQDNDLSAISDFYGLKPAVVMSYIGAGRNGIDSIPLDEWQALSDNGQVPYLTIELWSLRGDGYSLDEVAAGSYDKTLRAWARDIAAYGEPVLVRPFHEFNATWYVNWHVSSDEQAQDFVEAWDRMYDIFQEEGATNAVFVFSPNNVAGWDDAEEQYDRIDLILSQIEDEVDIIAPDGYGPPYGPFTFREAFAEMVNRLQKYEIPFIIGEFGSEEQKEDYYAGMDQDLRNGMFSLENSSVALITYFDVEKQENGQTRDFGVSDIGDLMTTMQKDNFYRDSSLDFLEKVRNDQAVLFKVE